MAVEQILVFDLAGEKFGVNIASVREVLNPQEIHRLPQAPDFVEGVINLRGCFIAVIDLNKKLGIKAGEGPSKRPIIICKIKKCLFGLLVDKAEEVVDLPAHSVSPLPEAAAMQKEGSFVAGLARIGEKVITLIDLEQVLSNQEIQKLVG